MVFGGILALSQWNIKRLFAYSSVSQVGLILLALGFGTTWGVVGALYHLVNHAVFKPLLFLNSGQVEDTAAVGELVILPVRKGRSEQLDVQLYAVVDVLVKSPSALY